MRARETSGPRNSPPILGAAVRSSSTSAKSNQCVGVNVPFQSEQRGKRSMSFPQSDLVASQSVERAAFESLYDGPAPWEIGRPQRQFVAIADKVKSPILDAGCGTGEHALFLASRGHKITGIDFVEEAIRRAKHKAAERNLPVEFLVQDVTKLGEWNKRFATAIDCGLFHVLSDGDWRLYVQ